eukprot:3656193-Alexandrium_andersonii.AAC.1
MTFYRPGHRAVEAVMHYSPGLAHSVTDPFVVARDYSFQVGAPGAVCVKIAGLPDLCDDPAYLAHMINDP